MKYTLTSAGLKAKGIKPKFQEARSWAGRKIRKARQSEYLIPVLLGLFVFWLFGPLGLFYYLMWYLIFSAMWNIISHASA